MESSEKLQFMAEMNAFKVKYEKELAELKRADANYSNKWISMLEYEQNMGLQLEEHEEEIKCLHECHAVEFKKMNTQYAEEIAKIKHEMIQLKIAHAEEIASMKANMDEMSWFNLKGDSLSFGHSWLSYTA